MDVNLQTINDLFNQFKLALTKGEFGKCNQVLSALKLKLTQCPSLPPLYKKTPSAQQELLLARDIFEHAIILSVNMKDEAAFERNFMQLKSYYTDTRDLIAPSQQEYMVLGLNLLRLLVQNRIAEFHTELELLTPEAQANLYVKYAIQVEQSLMEGAYQRVLSAGRTVPDKSYSYFMDLLVQTVRDGIAECSEKAYDFLTVADAKKLLMLPQDTEFQEYVTEHGWAIRNGCVYFQTAEAAPHNIPSLQLITQTLGYARELERIV